MNSIQLSDVSKAWIDFNDRRQEFKNRPNDVRSFLTKEAYAKYLILESLYWIVR